MAVLLADRSRSDISHYVSVKADKKAEIEKVERQIQQQQEREDEMRELALKLRRRYVCFAFIRITVIIWVFPQTT